MTRFFAGEVRTSFFSSKNLFEVQKCCEKSSSPTLFSNFSRQNFSTKIFTNNFRIWESFQGNVFLNEWKIIKKIFCELRGQEFESQRFIIFSFFPIAPDFRHWMETISMLLWKNSWNMRSRWTLVGFFKSLKIALNNQKIFD